MPRRRPSERPKVRRPRSCRPGLVNLEPRDLPAAAVGSVVASPSILSPPNGRFVTVEVEGRVFDSSPRRTPRAVFRVTDEYRRIEPVGRIQLKKVTPTVYDYKFTIRLQAQRAGSDPDGRHYYLLVAAQDDENAHGLTVPILVPHGRVSATAAGLSTSTARRRDRGGR